ncbi:MAG: hypothetical protein LBV03_06855 [Fusobacteriales bacterium]|jgi:hypothetical protein|nr:hypothetical protein [Fusobacteriales bacterium]
MKIKNTLKKKSGVLSFFLSAAAVPEVKNIYEVSGTDFIQTIWNNPTGSTAKYGDDVTITTSGSGNGAGIEENAGVYSNVGGDITAGNRLTIKTRGAADTVRTNSFGTNDSTGVVTIGNNLSVETLKDKSDCIIVKTGNNFSIITNVRITAKDSSKIKTGNNTEINTKRNRSHGIFLGIKNSEIGSNSIYIVTTEKLSDVTWISLGGNITAGILNIEISGVSSYSIHLVGYSLNVNSISGRRIHSEGTAGKFQTNFSGSNRQKVTLQGVRLTNDEAATSVITVSTSDVNNVGHFNLLAYKSGVTTPNDGDRFLKSYGYKNPEESVKPENPGKSQESEKGIPPPVNSQNSVITYRPSNYMSEQKASAEQGTLRLSTYHQRMGRQEKEEYAEDKQTWICA